MSLSCSCEDPGDCTWYYTVAEDFSVLKTKRARRCCSCKKKLMPGDDVVAFLRSRYPLTEVEEKIYGDDWEAVPLATWYMCETCGGLYYSISDLGFCCDIEEDIAAQIREYREAEREDKARELRNRI